MSEFELNLKGAGKYCRKTLAVRRFLYRGRQRDLFLSVFMQLYVCICVQIFYVALADVCPVYLQLNVNYKLTH